MHAMDDGRPSLRVSSRRRVHVNRIVVARDPGEILLVLHHEDPRDRKFRHYDLLQASDSDLALRGDHLDEISDALEMLNFGGAERDFETLFCGYDQRDHRLAIPAPNIACCRLSVDVYRIVLEDLSKDLGQPVIDRFVFHAILLMSSVEPVDDSACGPCRQRCDEEAEVR